MFFVKIPAAEALDLFKIRSNFPVFGVFALSFWTSIIPIIELQKNRRAGRFHSLVWGVTADFKSLYYFQRYRKNE